MTVSDNETTIFIKASKYHPINCIKQDELKAWATEKEQDLIFCSRQHSYEN